MIEFSLLFRSRMRIFSPFVYAPRAPHPSGSRLTPSPEGEGAPDRLLKSAAVRFAFIYRLSALRDPSSVTHTRDSFPRGEALTLAFVFERSREVSAFLSFITLRDPDPRGPRRSELRRASWGLGHQSRIRVTASPVGKPNVTDRFRAQP